MNADATGERPIDPLGPALLFCPGSRPDRFDKAHRAADHVVLDLEDGVAPDGKDRALAEVLAFVRTRAERVLVRVNRPATRRGQDEIPALAAAGVARFVLPKVESAADVDAALETAGAGRGVEVVVTIETARGVLALGQILARPGIAAVSWGPYDLAADIGLRGVRDEAGGYLPPLAHARDAMVLHAAAAGIPVFDTVTTEIRTLAQTERDAAQAALLGFAGKLAIHPSQVPAIRAAFMPGAAEVERSRRLVAAAAGSAVFLFEGEMVDAPILRRARMLIALAERCERNRAAASSSRS